MLKAFNYKTMGLGLCASMSLVGAANADCPTCTGDIIFVDNPIIGDVACGGAVRYETYTLFNTTPVDIPLGDFDILINPPDDFPTNEDLVSIVAGNYQSNDCIPGIGWELPAGNSCEITIKIDPTTLNCPVEGVVDRSLEVHFDTRIGEACAPIHFEVTPEGAAGGFALLGPNVYNGETSLLAQDPTVANGAANASQNIACTQPGCFLTQNIVLHQGAQRLAFNDPLTVAAVSDLEAAFNFYSNASCTPLDSTIVNGQTISSGTYCFTGDWPVTLPQNGTVKFSGSGDINLVIDFTDADMPPPDDSFITLFVSEGTNFLLQNGANADNIRWIVHGSVETQPNSRFAGAIMANGGFESEDVAGSPAEVTGRILLLNDPVYSASEPGASNIELFGNTIVKP